MGKKKNKNKVSGAVKTANKTEKKLANKLKKELANLGEEDIAKVIAEIEREESKRAAASEKTLAGPPSPRAYATLTPHPTTNELILFGGEYHNGQKTEVYNELLLYNPDKSTWRQVKAPGAPPPRSAHQAVATPANKGELWVFGGEFTSPTETQFHHYKDLWCFSLADKKWEKVSSPNGPSPRSGHRMVLLGRKLLVFGGYADDGRDCRYYDDIYAFCLDTRAWSRLTPAGKGPCARSACVMLPAGNDSLVIYGGFSRVREGRTEHTLTHADMFRLSATKTGGWSWRGCAGGALAPPPRASLAAAANTHTLKGYVFGGVADVEETEEELRGEMSDDLHLLDLESCKWHNVSLKSEQVAPAQVPEKVAEDRKGEVTVTEVEPGFTLKLGGSAPPPLAIPLAESTPRARTTGPSPRMSAMTCVQRSSLYVYGGVLERDDKQFYLSDMYSLGKSSRTWRHSQARRLRPAPVGSPLGRIHAPRPNYRPFTAHVRHDMRAKKIALLVRRSLGKGRQAVLPQRYVSLVEPGVTHKLGVSAPPPLALPLAESTPRARTTGPSPRMSAMTCVQRRSLYVYGGVLERDDKQFYLGDMYSLDLHKLNEWKTIIEQPSLPDWLGSDSDSEGSDEGSDDSDSEHTSDEG